MNRKKEFIDYSFFIHHLHEHSYGDIYGNNCGDSHKRHSAPQEYSSIDAMMKKFLSLSEDSFGACCYQSHISIECRIRIDHWMINCRSIRLNKHQLEDVDEK